MKRESVEGQQEVAREPGSAQSSAPRQSSSLSAVPPSSCRGQQGPSDRLDGATPRPSGGDQPSLALPQPHPRSPAWRRSFHPASLRQHRPHRDKTPGPSRVTKRTTSPFAAPRTPPPSSFTNPASPPEGGLRTRGARAPPTPGGRRGSQAERRSPPARPRRVPGVPHRPAPAESRPRFETRSTYREGPRELQPSPRRAGPRKPKGLG
ncbi:proline-rich protein HaeIII subfamily 1-like [Mustela nigripes]|uniref:proline-rich protein HaeIII subfamily 1-like n=1 Tax=Mustela lutreola TaxID=9666 RepID=UPI002797232E|nr:proline-rich protein HaeIII subfamily 1-like [Mustela lutreola]XP_059251458.1 proline-rich protein HaeIII subfamily 1-like [Mustela nigripes]